MLVIHKWNRLDLLGKLLISALLLATLMKMFTIFTLTVNWDEFYNLNLVYKFQQGTITNPYQTIMLRFFSWLPDLPISEIDQIIVARLVMFLFAVLTCLFIYKTARRFASKNAALFGVLSYISFYFTILYFTSFRVDGLITALLMAVIWLVSDPQQSPFKSAFCGIIIGLAGAISLKSIFYMPIIATFILTRCVASGWQKREFTNGLTMFVVALFSFVSISYFHGLNLESAIEQRSFLGRSLEHSFLRNPISSQFLYYLSAALFNPVLWFFTAFGLFALFDSFQQGSPQERANSIGLLSLLSPILTLLVYNHVAPYYYVYILAPSAVLVAVAADQYLSKQRRIPFTTHVLISISILLIGFGYSTIHGQKYQRELLSNIHSLFPTPVTYLDYCGMVPSFDRILEPGLFINPYSLDNSRYFSEAPFMEKLLEKHQPKFYLSNIAALDVDHKFVHSIPFKFSSNNEAALRNNFVHFWGPIFIAGKHLQRSSDNSEEILKIVIEGTYTLRGTSAVTIDDQKIEPNSTIFLSAGLHKATNIQADNIQLIWGEKLVKPEQTDTPKRLFWML